METISVDQIMQEIRREVARQISRRKMLTPTLRQQSGDIDLLYLKGQLEQVGAILNLAESRSHVRNHLPEKFQRSPLFIGKFRETILKGFNLAFRDQREVNAGLINASNCSNQVNQQILQELVSLRGQMKQMQDQLDRLSQSKS